MSIKDLFITGLSYVAQPAKRKLIAYSRRLQGKKGLEIGGPSSQFSLRGYFPVYVFARAVDGVNFSTETIWEGVIKEGNTYKYHTGTGYQYVKEAADLSGIDDNSYDFVLSCHSLEHVANPLKALGEWKRVLKPGGMLIVILPDKRYTFDVNRPYTTFDHLLADFLQHTDETDRTHFAEILEHHVLESDPGNNSLAAFEALLKDNYNNRRAHHHVFGQDVVKQMFSHLGFVVLHQQDGNPFHLITVAQKAAV